MTMPRLYENKRFLLSVLALCITFVCVSPSLYACEGLEEPNVFLEGLSTEIITEINKKNKANQNNHYFSRQLIEEMMIPHVDFKAASRRVLSNEWSKLTPDQKNVFINEFKLFVVRFASTIFGSYITTYDKDIEYDVIKYNPVPVKKKGGVIEVKSVVTTDNSKSYPVDFKLRCGKSSWKIVDVKIEYASIINTFNKQFKAMIERDGFNALVAFIKSRNVKMVAMETGTGATNPTELGEDIGMKGAGDE